jgi:hypothetical protein
MVLVFVDISFSVMVFVLVKKTVLLVLLVALVPGVPNNR